MKWIRESQFCKGFMLFGKIFQRTENHIFCLVSRKEERLISLNETTIIPRDARIRGRVCLRNIWSRMIFTQGKQQNLGSNILPVLPSWQFWRPWLFLKNYGFLHLASFAYFGRISDPAHTYEAYPNHKALENVHWVSNVSESPSWVPHGWGLSHSYGVILNDVRI